MIEWEEFSLRDLISVNPRLKLTKNEVARKIGMEHLIPNQKWPIDFEMTSFKGGSKFQNEDVLLARITPCLENGKTGMVRGLNHGEVAFGSTEFLVLRSDGPIDQTFLFYLAIEPNFREYAIQTMTGSSGRQRVQTDALLDFTLDLPSLEEQEAIAEVLSSLDDKIDLLKRQNKTLEGMAKALFRQWFVEEAQEDWEEVEFNTIAENVRNVMKPENLQGDVRLVGLEHFDSKSLVLNRYEQTNELGSQKYKFEQGQIMFGKLRPYFHNISLPFFSGVCSTDILIIEARDDIWTIFAFFFLNQDWVVEAATQSASGTRMPRTNWNFLGSLTVLLPEVESLSEFNTIARPMIEKIEKNWSEIRVLNQQRDTLLPKLMSGEVRVQMD